MEDYFNEISSERKRDCVPVRPVELVHRESDRNDVEEKQKSNAVNEEDFSHQLRDLRAL